MFKVGDIIVSTYRNSKLNFKVIEIKDESTIRIKSPRMEGGLYMLVNVNHWKLDVNYYRKLKLLKFPP